MEICRMEYPFALFRADGLHIHAQAASLEVGSARSSDHDTVHGEAGQGAAARSDSCRQYGRRDLTGRDGPRRDKTIDEKREIAAKNDVRSKTMRAHGLVLIYQVSDERFKG